MICILRVSALWMRSRTVVIILILTTIVSIQFTSYISSQIATSHTLHSLFWRIVRLLVIILHSVGHGCGDDGDFDSPDAFVPLYVSYPHSLSAAILTGGLILLFCCDVHAQTTLLHCKLCVLLIFPLTSFCHLH